MKKIIFTVGFLMTFSFAKSQELTVMTILDTIYNGATYVIKDTQGNVVEKKAVFDEKVFDKNQIEDEIIMLNSDIKEMESQIVLLKSEIEKKTTNLIKCNYFLEKLK